LYGRAEAQIAFVIAPSLVRVVEAEPLEDRTGRI
jgi:hypothetical protein